MLNIIFIFGHFACHNMGIEIKLGTELRKCWQL